ncbi:phage tail protein [Paenibacillus psychroresistens]|uniref:phage tail protein n=1 Tax=Paenibacillus psychroresistens TaxID=1778678 RepID=UPI001D0463A4
MFQVSADKIRTFDDFVRNNADRWESHEIIGQKPKKEFIGPGLDQITFNMRFDANLGVSPRKEMEALMVLSRNGKAAPLIIGGKALGVNKWIITGLVHKWKNIDNKGNLLQADLEISLEEYV